MRLTDVRAFFRVFGAVALLGAAATAASALPACTAAAPCIDDVYEIDEEDPLAYREIDGERYVACPGDADVFRIRVVNDVETHVDLDAAVDEGELEVRVDGEISRTFDSRGGVRTTLFDSCRDGANDEPDTLTVTNLTEEPIEYRLWLSTSSAECWVDDE